MVVELVQVPCVFSPEGTCIVEAECDSTFWRDRAAGPQHIVRHVRISCSGREKLLRQHEIESTVHQR